MQLPGAILAPVAVCLERRPGSTKVGIHEVRLGAGYKVCLKASVVGYVENERTLKVCNFFFELPSTSVLSADIWPIYDYADCAGSVAFLFLKHIKLRVGHGSLFSDPTLSLIHI